MKLKLFFLAVLATIAQHLLGLGVNLGFFVVVVLALQKPSVSGLTLCWLAGLLLDLSFSRHLGANAFSFLACYVILLQVSKAVSLESKLRIAAFCGTGFLLQKLLYIFALSFSVNDVFSAVSIMELLSSVLVAVLVSLLFPLKNRRHLAGRLRTGRMNYAP